MTLAFFLALSLLFFSAFVVCSFFHFASQFNSFQSIGCCFCCRCASTFALNGIVFFCCRCCCCRCAAIFFQILFYFFSLLICNALKAAHTLANWYCATPHDILISAAIDVGFISIRTHPHANSLENFRNRMSRMTEKPTPQHTYALTHSWEYVKYIHSHARTQAHPFQSLLLIATHTHVFGNLIHSKSITKAKPRTHKHEQ